YSFPISGRNSRWIVIMNQENAPNPASAIVCFDENQVEPLTGKPFFHMTMLKSHLTQSHLAIPTKSVELLPKKVAVPVVLTRGTRSWHMNYLSYQNSPRRFCNGWKAFVEDNMLKMGDHNKRRTATMDEENAPKPVSATICTNDSEVEPLTGKPFFDMIMCKSYLNTYLPIPTKFSGVLPENETVPVLLTRGNRSWYMTYSGYQYSARRICSGWKTFVDCNMLKVGDVCLFELMSSDLTVLKFKVQILRGNFPPDLLNREGETQDDSPVVVEIE
ncbi:hypothetical protein KSS87_005546, partial [Heliosperma pusillum]